jgi:glutaredoxin-related protein
VLTHLGICVAEAAQQDLDDLGISDLAQSLVAACAHRGGAVADPGQQSGGRRGLFLSSLQLAEGPRRLHAHLRIAVAERGTEQRDAPGFANASQRLRCRRPQLGIRLTKQRREPVAIREPALLLEEQQLAASPVLDRNRLLARAAAEQGSEDEHREEQKPRWDGKITAIEPGHGRDLSPPSPGIWIAILPGGGIGLSSAPETSTYPRPDFEGEIAMWTADDVKSKVESNKVIMFGKGTKEMPQCGFTMRAIQVLNSCNVDYECINIFDDASIRPAPRRVFQLADHPTGLRRGRVPRRLRHRPGALQQRRSAEEDRGRDRAEQLMPSRPGAG